MFVRTGPGGQPGGRRGGSQVEVSGSFPGVDESLTDRLTSTDLSSMNGAELLAHLDAVEQHMRNLQRAKLALLEDNPQIVAQRPELRALLEQLRSLNLDDTKGT